MLKLDKVMSGSRASAAEGTLAMSYVGLVTLIRVQSTNLMQAAANLSLHSKSMKDDEGG